MRWRRIFCEIFLLRSYATAIASLDAILSSPYPVLSVNPHHFFLTFESLVGIGKMSSTRSLNYLERCQYLKI